MKTEKCNDHPDKDAGVHFCSRCNSKEEFFYRYWPQKNHGYYIKFCRVCYHGNYMECPEAMPEAIKKSVDTIPLDRDKPWPTKDVLEKLIWATEYLLHEKDYDGHCP